MRPELHVISLAAIVPGQVVLVEEMLFDELRSLCADLGIREGTAVRCTAATPTHLLLEQPDGRVARLERGWARFIRATPARPAAASSDMPAAGLPTARPPAG